LKYYFKLLHKVLKEYKIKKINIYNINKKNFFLKVSAKYKLIYKKGKKNPKYI